ncbi:hypothetical protein GJAV_G00062460 [Gymnothorax javanicus]|nr:hypothetical protein GJAV_G00062460 [Gymnothorax javanicus]
MAFSRTGFHYVIKLALVGWPNCCPVNGSWHWLKQQSLSALFRNPFHICSQYLTGTLNNSSSISLRSIRQKAML